MSAAKAESLADDVWAYDVRAMRYNADLPRDLGVVNPFAILGQFLLRYYAALNLVSV
nr:hypothetical protein [Tanacetum cinerariifolium]